MKLKIIFIKLIQVIIISAIFCLLVKGKLIYIYSPDLTTYNIVNTLVTYLAFLIYLIIDFYTMLKTARFNTDEQRYKYLKKYRPRKLKKVSHICLALVFVVYIFTIVLATYKIDKLDKNKLNIVDEQLQFEGFLSDNFSNDLVTGFSRDFKFNDEYSKLFFYEAIKKQNTVYLENNSVYYSFDYIKGKKNVVDKAYKELIDNEFKIVVTKNNNVVENKKNRKAESIIVDGKIIGEYTLIESNEKVFTCVLKADNVMYKVHINSGNSNITISKNALNVCLKYVS